MISVNDSAVEALQAKVGTDVGVSEWFEIRQDLVTAFGGVTQDYDPHHIDPAQAKDGPFGAPTAQGFFVLSLLTRMAETAGFIPDHHHHMNYGLDRTRWVKPVPVGGRVRGNFNLLEVTRRRSDQLLIKCAVTVELEGEAEPCLYAEWLGLLL